MIKNILVSYWVLRGNNGKRLFDFLNVPERKGKYRVLIDSGAFSAWTQKKVIDVKEYSAWVKGELLPAIGDMVTGFFQLDVVCDIKKTRENLLAHEKLGLRPIPIFTRATTEKDLVYLHDLCRDYPWVGIGAIKGTAKEYVKYVLEHCSSEERRKLHLLGFGDIDFIRYYRPKSFDTSTWLNGARFGVQADKLGKMKRVSLTMANKRAYGIRDDLLPELKKKDLGSYKGKLMHLAQALNCSHWLERVAANEKLGITEYLVCLNADHPLVMERVESYFIDKKNISLLEKEVRK